MSSSRRPVRIDVDDRRRLDAGQDRARCQGKLDAPQAHARGQAEGFGGLAHVAGDVAQTGVRVTHDGQQRIQEEGADRRRLLRADEGNHEDQQGQRRDRLDDAGDAEHDLPEALVPRRQHAQRHGDEDRRRQRQDDQRQVLDGALHQARQHRGLLDGRRHAQARLEEVRRHTGLGLPVDLDPLVEARHGRPVDGSLDAAEGRHHAGMPRLEVGTVDEHGVVAREVRQVVGEHAQAVVLDLRVGGIQVHGVDVARLQRPVGQVVLQPAHVPLGQAVGVAQRGPAVAAIHELVAEAEDQVGVVAQVGDAFDAPLGGHRLAHAHGVGVVETEGAAETQALGLDRGSQAGQAR
jgi:hypothetical protein